MNAALGRIDHARHTVAGLVIGLCSLPAITAADEAATAAELGHLRGAWTVTAAEQGGKPFDAIKGGVLSIDGAAFALRTASGNELAGTIAVDPATVPKQLDFLHSTGAVWEAIYTVAGEVLRLNYVEQGDAPRPTVFATTADTPGTVIVLQKAPASTQ